MHPIHMMDLARLHADDLRRLTDHGRLRAVADESEPERHPHPPSPRLAIGRLVARLRASGHAGAGA